MKEVSSTPTEYYPDKLKREIQEIQFNHPGIDELLAKIKEINSRSNHDFDYDIERQHLLHLKVAEFIKNTK